MKQKLIFQKDFAKLAGVTQAAVSIACRGVLKPARVGRRLNAAHPVAREYVALRQAKINGAPDPLYEVALAHCIDSGRFTQAGLRRKFDISHGRSKRIMDSFKADGLVPEPVPKPAAAPEPKPKLPPKPKPKPAPVPKPAHVRGTAARKERLKREAPALYGDDEDLFEIPANILAFADMTLRDIVDKFGTDIRFKDYLAAVRRIEDIHEKRLKSAAREGELISRELVQTGVIDIFNAAHLRIMTDGAKSLVAGVVSKKAAGAGDVEIELYASEVLGSFIKPVKNKIARALNGA